jgi:DNA modification methylase
VLDVDEAEGDKLLATIDPLAAMAEADAGKLDELLREIDTGSDALQQMLSKLAEEAGVLDGLDAKEILEDEVPEVPVDPITKPGDLWVLGEHRVLCGDSTKAEDVERLLGHRKPFLMVTDPPYGVEYETAKGAVTNDDRFDWTESYRLFAGDVAYVWHGERTSLDVGINLRATGFEVRGRIIWVKPSLTMGRGHYHFQHEGAWYSVRKNRISKWCGDSTQSTVWKIDREDHAHPTVKPVECMARPIRNHGDVDDDVYDPFLGSGTTLIAAEQLGRRCYGMEISPQYCDVIVKRWETLTGRKAVRDAR